MIGLSDPLKPKSLRKLPVKAAVFALFTVNTQPLAKQTVSVEN